MLTIVYVLHVTSPVLSFSASKITWRLFGNRAALVLFRAARYAIVGMGHHLVHQSFNMRYFTCSSVEATWLYITSYGCLSEHVQVFLWDKRLAVALVGRRVFAFVILIVADCLLWWLSFPQSPARRRLPGVRDFYKTNPMDEKR